MTQGESEAGRRAYDNAHNGDLGLPGDDDGGHAGPWIFGKKVLIPAGIIRDIDPDTQTVFVDRTKDEIKNAPEYDESMTNDPAYRDRVGSYYGPTGT